MDDQRIGAVFRAVRIRRGWTQAELAKKARVSPGVVSLIERGHLENVSPRAFRRVATALEIRAKLVLWLPHGELDRLMNAGHAAMHEALSRLVEVLPGWSHAHELSFAVYGERGVIDILAFHEPTGSLLVIELKTEIVSVEEILAKMDVRLRHARGIARERGWRVRSVSAWLVIAESDTNRRRVKAHRATFRAAFPNDGRRMRAWLRAPDGPVRALSSGQTSAEQPLRGQPRQCAGSARCRPPNKLSRLHPRRRYAQNATGPRSITVATLKLAQDPAAPLAEQA